jgi:hypothetical protein
MTGPSPLRRLGGAGILVTLLLVAALACSWLAPLDTAANSQIDKSLKRALVSFAAARALNAIISVAQGTELSLQPMGVGVNLTVGQVLDPVNDVIEQFSTLMLVASVAFGIQKVLLAIGAHWTISVLLTAAAAAWAVLAFRQRRSPPWLAQVLVVVLMVRFAVPVVTLGSDALFQQFLAADYAVSQQVLARTTLQLDKASPAAGPADKQGLLERMSGWAGSQGAAWKERFDGLKEAAEQATEHIVKLMVIFILQTLVLPLALLWALYALARAVVRRSLYLAFTHSRASPTREPA